MNFYRVVEITATSIKSYKFTKNSSNTGYHLELNFHKQFIKDLLTTFKNLSWEVGSAHYLMVFNGEFPPLVKARLKMEIAEFFGQTAMCFDFNKRYAQCLILNRNTNQGEISIMAEDNRLLCYYQAKDRLLSKFFALDTQDLSQISSILTDYLTWLDIGDGLAKVRFFNFDENYDAVLKVLSVFEVFFPFAKVTFDERDLVSLAFK